MTGQAASYYDPNQTFQPGYGHGSHFPPSNPGYQNLYARPPEPKPPQEPPTYNQAVYGFDDAFKVEKPRFNDLWAGLLVCSLMSLPARKDQG